MTSASDSNPALPYGADDTDLVRLAKSGDLHAFETLVSRHEQQAYSVALRILRHPQDAEDVTQQALVSALENLQSFREESRFGTWLLRITTYAALKVIRKRTGLPTVPLEHSPDAEEGLGDVRLPEFIADWRESPEQLVLRNETRELLQRALDELDEKHRLVFLLRDVEGLSVRETAEALGISEANTKVRLLRARLQLRELLTRSLGDPEKRVMPGHPH